MSENDEEGETNPPVVGTNRPTMTLLRSPPLLQVIILESLLQVEMVLVPLVRLWKLPRESLPNGTGCHQATRTNIN
jgi:hypothetical protein